MKQSDILIIGAGIVGTALARELSRLKASVTVLDSGYDIAEGATKANSGIIHAGYDAEPNTLKAKYNVLGAAMYPALCESLGVSYRRCGAFVIGFTEEDVKTLHALLERGKQNGVRDLAILSREEALSAEPSLNPEIQGALSVPGSAIVSPYEVAYAFADDAALNGVTFLFHQRVIAVSQSGHGGWKVQTEEDEFETRVLVNCAGAFGAELHNLISDSPLTMVHRRGQYYLLDRAAELPFSRTIFQCPSRMGKGVLISPTVHGNTIIGPNAEDIDDPLDTATTAEGLESVIGRAVRTWPALSVRTNITNFSGIRAHLKSGDFVIGPVSGAPGAFEAIGIESPGLSSAPAIARDLAEEIASCLRLEHKKDIIPLTKQPKPFHDMNDSERAEAVQNNPEYGNIVCRCEVVTEAEIRLAIRRPVKAGSIDGIKRRTRAGMGRCQGGFCSPRVAEIIAEEYCISPLKVTKNGGNSYLLSDTVEAFLKGDCTRD